MGHDSLPELPLDDWEDSKRTLHLYCQVLGKIRLASQPRLNHWWHVTLYPSASGITTGRLMCTGGAFEVRLDLLAHRLVIESGTGVEQRIELGDGLSVARFYEGAMDALASLGLNPSIALPRPFDVPGESVPFVDDRRERRYDRDAVQRYWSALVQIDDVLREFRGRFVGKSSPVHLFWHHMDLALARFSGRQAPVSPGAGDVERQAYSHEVIAFGWWAGDAVVREPAFYSYTAPAPDGLTDFPLAGPGANWDREKGQALLTYDAVRATPDPRKTILDFFESAYQAGARAADWPAGLDMPGDSSNTP